MLGALLGSIWRTKTSSLVQSQRRSRLNAKLVLERRNLGRLPGMGAPFKALVLAFGVRQRPGREDG
jgi:hypothetical protein